MGLYGNLINHEAIERLGAQYAEGRRLGAASVQHPADQSATARWQIDHPGARARIVQLYRCLFPSRGEHG